MAKWYLPAPDQQVMIPRRKRYLFDPAELQMMNGIGIEYRHLKNSCLLLQGHRKSRPDLTYPFSVPGRIIAIVLYFKSKAGLKIEQSRSRVFYEHDRNIIGPVIQEMPRYPALAGFDPLIYPCPGGRDVEDAIPAGPEQVYPHHQVAIGAAS